MLETATAPGNGTIRRLSLQTYGMINFVLPLQRLLSCRQYPHHLQTDTTVGTRLCLCAYGIGEILTLQPQWLNPINMRNGDLTKAIRHHRIGINMGSFVVNLEHLSWIGVVVDCHSHIANNRHTANFTGM